MNLPNAAIGLVFYITALVGPKLGVPRQLFLAASVLSLGFSAFLAYVLRFVLGDLCLVCVSSYTLNAAIFVGVARGVMAGPGHLSKRKAAKVE
jgi:vitamin-K-epoxide reductase (warfarin-sensitive)